jgi:hypothetical protein
MNGRRSPWKRRGGGAPGTHTKDRSAVRSGATVGYALMHRRRVWPGDAMPLRWARGSSTALRGAAVVVAGCRLAGEHLSQLPCRRVDVEAVRDRASSRVSQPPAQGRVCDEFVQVPRHRTDVVGCGEPAVDAVAKDLADPARGGGDDGQPAGHGLDDDVRYPVPVAVRGDARGQGEDVGAPVGAQHRCAVPLPRELDGIAQAQPVAQRGELRPQRPVAVDTQPEGRRRPG